ncbi:hypothetical protein [Caballeronia sp. DA-9]|uniref:hypothetical protein n=1 Tax=Caballeronia sp. DA-9 TaxID=3436237 RepID=UPI003F67B7E2
MLPTSAMRSAYYDQYLTKGDWGRIFPKWRGESQHHLPSGLGLVDDQRLRDVSNERRY